VAGENYSVVRYNFYYFEYYNTFLDDNADDLDALGYDPNTDSGKQSYDGSITWEAFFQQQAEANLAETAYYCDLAQAAGYVFSDEELAPVEERLAEHEAQQTLYGLSDKNYFVSYYGSGMTKDAYTDELTRMVKAQAYKAYLTKQYTPQPSEVADWISTSGEAEDQADQLQVITLEAQPDRASGEVGQAQLDALTQKLDRLSARYAAGEDFDALQAAFSTRALGDRQGYVIATRAADLPQALAARYIDDQRTSDVDVSAPFSYVDRSTGVAYFVRWIGAAGSGPALDAVAALSAHAIEEQEAQGMANYTVQRNSLVMQLAAS
jgi:hypothetical protein